MQTATMSTTSHAKIKSVLVFLGIGELFGTNTLAKTIFEWTIFRLDVMDYTNAHFVSLLIEPTGSFADHISPAKDLEHFIFP